MLLGCSIFRNPDDTTTIRVSVGQYLCLLRGQRPPFGITHTVPFMGCCNVCGLDKFYPHGTKIEVGVLVAPTGSDTISTVHLVRIFLLSCLNLFIPPELFCTRATSLSAFWLQQWETAELV